MSLARRLLRAKTCASSLALLLLLLSRPPPVAANAPCRSPGGGFSNSTRLELHFLGGGGDDDGNGDGAGPACLDGSRAAFYYRPCCDGEDPLDFCNASALTNWFVVFESNAAGSGWCFSEDSCARRPRAAVGSGGLPPFFPRSDLGIFSIAGEQNPNFYKAYAACVGFV